MASFEWPPQGAGGGGTVFSVGLSAPASILTVSGSPVTTTGTLALSLATQSANLVWAGPTTGSAATPTFRSLVTADLPFAIGNLTDAGTDGITVTGGTGCVIGSGTSLSQHVADTTHNGYLSSTDWNTFNSKAAALSGTTGYHAKFTSSTAIGNSNWAELGSNGEFQFKNYSSAKGTAGTPLIDLNPGTGLGIHSSASNTFDISVQGNDVMSFTPQGTNTNTLNGTVSTLVLNGVTGSITATSSSGAYLQEVNPTVTLSNNKTFVGSYNVPIISMTSTNQYIADRYAAISGTATATTFGVFQGATSGMNGAIELVTNLSTTGSSTSVTAYATGNKTVGTRSWVYSPVGSSPFAVATSGVAGLNNSSQGVGGFFRIINDASTSAAESALANIRPNLTAALVADNGDTGQNIANFLANGVSKVFIDGSGNLNIAGLTASELVATDSSKNLISVATITGAQLPTFTGDVTNVAAAMTLATVNSNVGSFTNANITVNAKGLITAASNGSAPATSNYFNGAFSPNSSWSTTSNTFTDPTNSGGNTLTTRFSSGMTVTAGASNVIGLTWTPTSSTAVYFVSVTFTKTNNGADTDSFRLYDGTVLVCELSNDFGNTGTGRLTMTMNGIYVPGTASAVTLKLQAATSSGTLTIVNNGGSLTDNIVWNIFQLVL